MLPQIYYFKNNYIIDNTLWEPPTVKKELPNQQLQRTLVSAPTSDKGIKKRASDNLASPVLPSERPPPTKTRPQLSKSNKHLVMSNRWGSTPRLTDRQLQCDSDSD
jgi:hypothetical protein